MSFNIKNIAGLVRVGKTLVAARRPEILLGTSLTATIASVGLAARAGYEARGLVEEAQNPTVDLSQPENQIDLKEKVRLTWKCYLPAAASTIGALGSIGGLHIVHMKDKKAMAAAYLVAVEEVKSEAQKFHDEVMEVVDENATPKVKEKIDAALKERHLGKNPFYSNDPDGEVEDLYLVRDGWTGRDIYSSRRRIDDAVNEVNNLLNMNGEVSLTDFYQFAGFSPIEGSENLGWSGNLMEVRWYPDERIDGRPVRAFRFLIAPSESAMGNYS